MMSLRRIGLVTKMKLDRINQSNNVDMGVQRAIDSLRCQLRREAVAFALEALHQWVSRGVEEYHATRGWIFLAEPGPPETHTASALNSIPSATVRSRRRRIRFRLNEVNTSLAWQVFNSGVGEFSNDISTDPRRYVPIEKKASRSHIAVPLFDEKGQEEGAPIGVYILEADDLHAFFPNHVQELQKNVALLTPHLLILKKLQDQKHHDEPWIWHPEVHGWSPGKLAERFCHAVVQGATLRNTPQLTCAIWNADIKREHCWVLGTCGYDHEFQKHLTLGINESLTGKVSRHPLGNYKRGPVDKADFYNYEKARRMKVQQIHIGSLQSHDGKFSGTINVYSLDKSTILPGIPTMRWLCEQASLLLGDVNEMRLKLGIAHVNGQLARAADATPLPGVFRRALTTILPCDAASLFVPRSRNGKTTLVSIETTGFRRGRSNVEKEVEFPVESQGVQASITAHCFSQRDPVRVNFRSELESGIDDVPRPSTQHAAEVVMYSDADPLYRRRLGCSVPRLSRGNHGHPPDAIRDTTGVVRMYRSSAGRPFTEADAELVHALVSIKRCRLLFENWAGRCEDPNSTRLNPDIPIPPSRSVLASLQKLVQELDLELEKPNPKIKRGYVLIYRGDGYREFVFYPPYDFTPKPSVFNPDPNQPAGVFEIDHNTYRAWVRLPAWSGEHMMRTILAFDFASHEAAAAVVSTNGKRVHKEVHKTLIQMASLWTMNAFYPGAITSRESIIAEFEAYVMGRIGASNRSIFEIAKYCDIHDASDVSSSDEWCPEPDLNEYGVTIKIDGSECRILLRTGRKETGILTCRFRPDFATRMHAAMSGAEHYHSLSTSLPPREALVDHAAAWSELRRGIGRIVGAWTRIVAPTLEERFADNSSL